MKKNSPVKQARWGMASNKWFHAPLWASRGPLGGQKPSVDRGLSGESACNHASLGNLSLPRSVCTDPWRLAPLSGFPVTSDGYTWEVTRGHGSGSQIARSWRSTLHTPWLHGLCGDHTVGKACTGRFPARSSTDTSQARWPLARYRMGTH